MNKDGRSRSPVRNWLDRRGPRSEEELLEDAEDEESRAKPEPEWPGYAALSPERRAAVGRADTLIVELMRLADILANPAAPIENALWASIQLEKARTAIESPAFTIAWIELAAVIEDYSKRWATIPQQELMGRLVNDYASSVPWPEYAKAVRHHAAGVLKALAAWSNPSERWNALRELAIACEFDPPPAAEMAAQYEKRDESDRL